MSFFEFPHTRTYDSDLGWLIKCCKTVEETLEALNRWKDEVDPKIEDFYELYNQMINGDLPDGVIEGIKKWLDIHGADILGELVKMVFFGITEDGYFVAYIPDSWDEITFNTTGLDINIPLQPEYGHLVLSY